MELKVINYSLYIKEVQILKALNFTLKEGKITGVIGPSGSGKTLTFKGLTGLLKSKNITLTGQFYLDKKQVSPQEVRQMLGGRIAYIMQNPMTAFHPYLTLGHQGVETLKPHCGGSKKKSQQQLIDWFKKVGLKDPEKILTAYAHELSGGMLQRVMIAIAMASKAELIIADEPTSALDALTQRAIVDLMVDLNKTYKVSIALIVHDLGIAYEVAHEIIYLEKGRMVEQNQGASFFSHPKSPKSQRLIEEMQDARNS